MFYQADKEYFTTTEKETILKGLEQDLSAVMDELGNREDQDLKEDITQEEQEDDDYQKFKKNTTIDPNKDSNEDFDLNEDVPTDPRNQLEGFTVQSYDSRIQKNPDLFEKLKAHFLKLFPGMTVSSVNELIDKYGNQVLGQVVGNAITLDENSAFQSTLAHEFAEVYVDLIKVSDPILYKKGLEQVKDTTYHLEAQTIYADYSPEVQLKEALVQAIAEQSTEKLIKKFEAKDTNKFLAWMKNLWNRIKAWVSKKAGNNAVGILSNDMALKTNPILQSVPNISLRYQLGRQSENQSKSLNFMKNVANTEIIKAKIHMMEGSETAAAQTAYTNTYDSLFKKYAAEKTGKSSGVKIFGSNDIGVSKQEIESGEMENAEMSNVFKGEFQKRYPDHDAFIVNAIITATKATVVKDIDHSKNEVKAVKGISQNARVIMSSLIDYETGSALSKDQVEKTVLAVAEQSENATVFMQELKRRAIKDVVAGQLLFVLNNIGPDYSDAFVRELSSMDVIEFTGPLLEKDKEGVTRIKMPIRNSDYNQVRYYLIQTIIVQQQHL